MWRRGLEEIVGRQSRWAMKEGREMGRGEQKGHESKGPRRVAEPKWLSHIEI